MNKSGLTRIRTDHLRAVTEILKKHFTNLSVAQVVALAVEILEAVSDGE